MRTTTGELRRRGGGKEVVLGEIVACEFCALDGFGDGLWGAEYSGRGGACGDRCTCIPVVFCVLFWCVWFWLFEVVVVGGGRRVSY